MNYKNLSNTFVPVNNQKPLVSEISPKQLIGCFSNKLPYGFFDATPYFMRYPDQTVSSTPNTINVDFQ